MGPGVITNHITCLMPVLNQAPTGVQVLKLYLIPILYYLFRFGIN
jgi:hypothetical protein